jgi:glycine/D-amino acid oxidase-like deaminating enzyme
MTLDYSTKRLKRESTAPLEIKGDICVVGAGIAGVSAALEAAQLGRRVILIDSGQTLGGQSVGSMIGTSADYFPMAQNHIK